jgi:uncharacterized cofD-like protein
MASRRTAKISRLLQSAILKLRWLVPGIGVKRWVLVILVGTTILGLGLTVFLLGAYRTVPEGWWIPFIQVIALQSVTNRILRALIFGVVGVALIVVGIIGLNRALLRPFMRPGKDVIEMVAEYRRKDKGPRIVVIGGGTGLTSLLRGLKAYSRNITAIVTVADDGGSSGEIRKSVGILPPGDLRNCLAALSDDEEMITQIFQYRFAESAGLGGHSLGNLLITALTEITGSFESAIAESARVLSVQGNVFPSTLKNINLVAEVELPERKVTINVKGESEISKMGGRVHHVWLDPANPTPFPPTLQAILNADLILVGPGSLYTSIIANLLVPDLVDAIKASRAYKFYVCNIATQRGETDGYSCEDHVRTIERHAGARLFDVVLANNRFDESIPGGVEWVKVEKKDAHYQIYETDLVDKENPWRHSSAKVAKAIMDLYLERTGPLSSRDVNSTI